VDVSLGLRVLAPYILAAIGVVVAAVALALVLRAPARALLAGVSAASDLWDGASRAGLLLSLTLVWWLGSIELSASAGLAAGMPVGAWSVAVASISAVVMLWFAARALVVSRHLQTCGVVVLCAAGIIGVSLLVSGVFYDVSWDGNTAHQVAVTELASGWNPVYHPVVDRSRIDQWLATENFPKGTWIRGAAIFDLTGLLEQAKASGLILAAATWFAWVAFIAAFARGRNKTALVLATLVVMNPVVLAQAFTFMVDGQVASLFALSLALSGLLFARHARWPVAAALGITLMMLATAQFTGLWDAFALPLGFLLNTPAGRPARALAAYDGR